MRDGRAFSYDQHDPPEDGGRPTSEAVIGGADILSDRPGLRVELLADVEELGISGVLTEPGGPSPPEHLHRRHVESFYVLEGEMTFTAAGQVLQATAGTWVQVPPDVPHTFACALAGGALPGRPLRAAVRRVPRGLHRARTDAELAAVRAAFDQEPA